MSGVVTGMITNMFGLQGALLRAVSSMASNTAGQMLDGSAVNRCGGFNLSQIAVAGLVGAISPSFTPTRNPIINHAVTQEVTANVVGLF